MFRKCSKDVALSCLIGSFLAFSFPAHAEWQAMFTITDEGKTPKEIERILSLDGIHPVNTIRDLEIARLLSGQPVRHITYIKVTSTKMKWVGETECSKDSRRLYTISSELSYNWSDGTNSGAFESPIDGDPCASTWDN